MFKSLKAQGALGITLAAAGILMITMGARQSIGLFVGPINTSTGLGIATISFALAIAQFTWGAVQPLAGAAAGCEPHLVLTGMGEACRNVDPLPPDYPPNTRVHENLAAFVDFVLARAERQALEAKEEN